jgi:hypothetical protein
VSTCHGAAGASRLLDYAVNKSTRHPVNLSTGHHLHCLLSSSTSPTRQRVYCHPLQTYIVHGSLAWFPALLSRVAAGPVSTCHGVAGASRLLDYAVNMSTRHPVNLSIDQ